MTLVQQQGEEEYADLPIHARPMGFNAVWDNDEMGRRTYGADERDDVVDGEWIFAKASLDGAAGNLGQGVLHLHQEAAEGGRGENEGADGFDGGHLGGPSG